MTDNVIDSETGEIVLAGDTTKETFVPEVVLSTLAASDFETTLKIIQATTDATPISDILDKPITLTNVIAQRVPINKKDDKGNVIGVDTTSLVVLIDDKGNAYRALSPNLLRAVSNMLATIGYPSTWPYPLSVKVVEGRNGGRKFYDLRILGKAE